MHSCAVHPWTKVSTDYRSISTSSPASYTTPLSHSSTSHASRSSCRAFHSRKKARRSALEYTATYNSSSSRSTASLLGARSPRCRGSKLANRPFGGAGAAGTSAVWARHGGAGRLGEADDDDEEDDDDDDEDSSAGTRGRFVGDVFERWKKPRRGLGAASAHVMLSLEVVERWESRLVVVLECVGSGGSGMV